MKHLLLGVSTFFLSISCKKNTGEPELFVSKTTVERGEIVTASIINIPTGTRVAWQLPGFIKQATPDSSKISTLFIDEDGGTYDIKARLYSPGAATHYAFLSHTVTVKKRDFVVPQNLPGNDIKSTISDRLTLTPFFMGDSTLAFVLTTKQHYDCLNAYVVARDYSITNSIIKTSFKGVWQQNPGVAGNVPVQNLLITRKWFSDGTYPVEFDFNGTVYKGTLVVSELASTYEFIWPHTDGIVIERKVLSRYY